FRYPRDPQKIFIKRVVGIGGDHVHFDERTFSLNGTPVPATRDGDYSYQDVDPNLGKTETMHGEVWREQLDGRTYRTLRQVGEHVAVERRRRAGLGRRAALAGEDLLAPVAFQLLGRLLDHVACEARARRRAGGEIDGQDGRAVGPLRRLPQVGVAEEVAVDR